MLLSVSYDFFLCADKVLSLLKVKRGVCWYGNAFYQEKDKTKPLLISFSHLGDTFRCQTIVSCLNMLGGWWRRTLPEEKNILYDSSSSLFFFFKYVFQCEAFLSPMIAFTDCHDSVLHVTGSCPHTAFDLWALAEHQSLAEGIRLWVSCPWVSPNGCQARGGLKSCHLNQPRIVSESRGGENLRTERDPTEEQSEDLKPRCNYIQRHSSFATAAS